LVGDVIKFLDYLGYRVVSIEPGWKIRRPANCIRPTLFLAANDLAADWIGYKHGKGIVPLCRTGENPVCPRTINHFMGYTMSRLPTTTSAMTALAVPWSGHRSDLSSGRKV
jgi:hypothetical protein